MSKLLQVSVSHCLTSSETKNEEKGAKKEKKKAGRRGRWEGEEKVEQKEKIKRNCMLNLGPPVSFSFPKPENDLPPHKSWCPCTELCDTPENMIWEFCIVLSISFLYPPAPPTLVLKSNKGLIHFQKWVNVGMDLVP